MSPHIDTVSLKGRQAVITGSAASEARVVLRGDEGETYAVVVDENGRFELMVELADDSVVLIPEVQQGQDAIKGPERLVILSNVALAVIQTDGGGSQRLTPGPALDAIDSDGQAMVASGRGVPGQSVHISVPGSFETTVKIGDDRRWSTPLAGVPNKGFMMSIDGKSFAYPGPGHVLDNEENQQLVPISGGWRLTRRIGNRAFLTSWFPDPE